MKIAFVTTQSLVGSTVVGRVVPLAQELTREHDVHVFAHRSKIKPSPKNITYHHIGRDPFQRTAHGKKRLSGLALVLRMFTNAVHAATTLTRLKPDAIVISKSLPENVLAAWLVLKLRTRTKIILDVDDFELTANVLTSLNQRAAIHWAERTAAKMAHVITTATPFLKDHFQQLAPDKRVEMIPTGISKYTEGSEGGEFSRSRRGRRASDSEREISDEKIMPPRSQSPALLYIGSISISSGHRVDLLPEILEYVLKTTPAAHLYIAGSGDDSEKVKKQFAQRGLTESVTWHGRFTLSEVAGFLSNTDILIDPIDDSIANRAKSSFRTALAAATGTPIVTSDIGIRPYLLPFNLHQRFFAFPAAQKEYAEKIVSLSARPLTPEERAAMVQHSARYQWPIIAEQFASLLSS